MNEVIEFLTDCGVFFLATVEGDQPKVRPYGFVMVNSVSAPIIKNPAMLK
ncbi:hypothetical protein [Acetobacterium sp. UBA5834]|jgi:uncharacterized pyridoxamine 5'-phosphate oxidase family protein